MNTREQFGKYLLLKKLTEDSLGESFRAGMLGNQGMERVVLLRVFNGQPISGERLWEAVADRAGVQQVLRSPNIGEGVELGKVQGIPYAAYDYVSGKNLANLLQQAAKRQSFIPTEHAILITERIALALALAGESRFQGARVLHGFLVPQLVMISNEGETRLVGFEVAPGLRGFSANPVIRQHFGRYLSPEAMAGAATEASDDIYSLGVLLYELLTGAPLPAPAEDGYSSIIEQAKLATEGTPFPAELKELLSRSLVTRDNRLQDVVAWHKSLNRWMFEGQYNPTTFNLAFFMHNLFRQEIERESQEIEVEKTLPLPVVQAGKVQTGTLEIPTNTELAATSEHTSGAIPLPAVAAAEAEGQLTSGSTPTVAADEGKKSKTGLWLLLAALLLAALAAGYFFFPRPGQDNEPAASTATPLAMQLPAEESPSELADGEMVDGEMGDDGLGDGGLATGELADGESATDAIAAAAAPADVQAQIDAMIEQKATAMEAQLRKKFDQELAKLQSELETAKQATAKREEELLAQQLAEQQEQEAAQEAERLAQEEAAKQTTAAVEQAAASPTDPASGPASGPDATQTAAASTQPAAQGATSAPPPKTNVETVRPKVRRGDLVKMGKGVVEPKVLRRASPRFPEVARRMGKPGGTVKVRVLIDENGKVLRTELLNKLGFGFDGEALNAAKRATWAPATKYGVPVKMWKELSVTFQK